MAKKNAIVTKKSLKFLEQYVNNPSPTSFEVAGQKMWLEYLKPYIDDYIVDDYGTVAGVINPGQDYSVAIEAHADEISWYVYYITDEGFIYLTRNGGSDHQIAPSKRVNIHTSNGIVKGVFGWPAIHTRRPGGKEEQPPKPDNIFLDIGAKDKKEVEKMGVHVGCVVTYEDEFMVMNDRFYVGRALDNRAGGFMIAEVARLLKENKKQLPYTLYIVNSVQEEVGLNGAKMIAYTLKPNAAIITDVCHDTNTPMIDKKLEGDFKGGRGPVVMYGPAVQNNLRELIMKVAGENKIDIQRSAASRGTGTDTDAFAFNRGGIPSALISLPLKYMHTTVEMVHKEDLENVVRLIYESLLKIKKGHSFKYL
jgi:putative aminopeptidase FrvX